jgi:LPS export ABC transporter protein LptC
MRTRTSGKRCRTLLGILLMVAACRRKPSGPAEAQSPDMEPDQTLATFTMDSYVGALRQWSLKSPHADLFDREHRVELVSPQVRFFNEGRAGSKVNAAQGRLDTETKDFWAGGGVVMASTDGVHLESDWVRYEKSADRFVSTAPVTVTRGRSIVKGVGWEARSDLSDMVIREQRGEIAPEDNRLIKNK